MGRQAAALNDNILYVEIPETGHLPMLEDQGTYLRRVQEFLRHGIHSSGTSNQPSYSN